jgi:hypothetical protein
MVTVAEIYTQLRQHCERIDGAPWGDEALHLLWMDLVVLAYHGRDHLVQQAPSGHEAHTRQFLAELEEVYGEEVARVRRVLEQFRAKALRRGCSPEGARDEAARALKRAYAKAAAPPAPVPGRCYSFREIRARVEQKLRVCDLLTEGGRLGVCWGMVQLLFDRSGLSLRLSRTDPYWWSTEVEGALERMHHRFARELDLLHAETARRFERDEDRGVPELVSCQRVTRRLLRQFVGTPPESDPAWVRPRSAG